MLGLAMSLHRQIDFALRHRLHLDSGSDGIIGFPRAHIWLVAVVLQSHPIASIGIRAIDSVPVLIAVLFLVARFGPCSI